MDITRGRGNSLLSADFNGLFGLLAEIIARNTASLHFGQDMEEFELPVTYRNAEHLLPARFVQAGYTYRIEVACLGHWVIFEPDEERNWRARMEGEVASLPSDWLPAIAAALDEVTK